MTNSLDAGALAAQLLSHFSPIIRAHVLRSENFRDRFGLNVDGVVGFPNAQVHFRKSVLFGALRHAVAGPTEIVTVSDLAKQEWTLTLSDSDDSCRLAHAERRLNIPNVLAFSADREKRIGWLDKELARYKLGPASASNWRSILNEREVSDDEFDQLAVDLRNTPGFFSSTVLGLFQQATIQVASLVPEDIRYFERLVGTHTPQESLPKYIETSVAPLIEKLLADDPREGLKQALLLGSSPLIVQTILANEIPLEALGDVFLWLEANGDTVSLVAATELGLARVADAPELATSIASMIKRVIPDADGNLSARLERVCALITFVEGELATNGLTREKPPFWRRLASIAHASILERAVIAGGIQYEFIEWAKTTRDRLFSLQSIADMRVEPRWVPEFLSPNQLNDEFIGRIATASDQAVKLESGELRELLYEGDLCVRSKVRFPFSYFPGPLEGGLEAKLEIPAELEEEIRQKLTANELTPESFAGIINSAFLFRVDSNLAELAAETLRRVHYQIHGVSTGDTAYLLLNGLTNVAAVARCVDLTQEVRVLTQVLYEKVGSELSFAGLIHIALTAAAAHSEKDEWCKCIGAWLGELAFGELSIPDAALLRDTIEILRTIIPELWQTTSQADAALTAVIRSQKE